MKKSIFSLLMLCCLLILFTLPRFNGGEKILNAITSIKPGESSLDGKIYMHMTSYFRGEAELSQLTPPYTYRPLAPFLAAQLPFDAKTSVNVLNIIFLMIAIFFLYAILSWFKFDFRLKIIGCLLFIISFPTFYYASVGYIDPVFISLLTIGLYLILRNKWIYLALLIIIGVFVKETVILLLPLMFIYLFQSKKIFKKEALIMILIFFFSSIAYYFSRRIIPLNPNLAWVPSKDLLIMNLLRPRTYISFLLSFGIPGVLSLFIFSFRSSVWFKERWKETQVLISGVILALLLSVYSLFSAFTDGRFIWVAYPFAIPLSIIVLDELFKKKFRIDKQG